MFAGFVWLLAVLNAPRERAATATQKEAAAKTPSQHPLPRISVPPLLPVNGRGARPGDTTTLSVPGGALVAGVLSRGDGSVLVATSPGAADAALMAAARRETATLGRMVNDGAVFWLARGARVRVITRDVNSDYSQLVVVDGDMAGRKCFVSQEFVDNVQQ
jgi:hypothetical protein